MNRTLVALSLAVCLGIPAYSQSLTTLSGSIVDPTGAAVPGTTISLTNIDNNTKREGISDAAGKYSFSALSPGTYRLLAKKQGFSDISVQQLRLLVSTPSTLNLTFETVGAVAQTIEIAAEGIQLNTVDATVGNSFGTKPITQLPFEGRRADRILSLQPGISYIGDSDTVNGGSNVGTDRGGVVNGGKSDQSNLTLDGIDINNQQTRQPFNGALRVTLDSVQEFRVTTSNANADSSRGSGAQITLVTRSGTNELHGAAYWFVRNKIFNANTFFNNLTTDANGRGLDTPKLNRNTFGGRIGGPIKKNKLFYFANWEGQRDRLEQSVVRIVPRANLRAGNIDFLTVGGGRSTVTSAELVNRLADARSVNQASLDVLRGYPLPNDFTTGDGINTAGFRFNTPLARRYNTYVAKIDYVLNDRNRLFARGQLQNDNEANEPQFPGQAANFIELNNSKGIAIGWDSTINNSLISSTRWGLTRQGVETSGSGNFALTAYRTAFLDNPVGLTRSFRRFSPTYNFTQDFTWTKGKHTIQFGGSIRVFQNDRSNFANSFFAGVMNPSWMTASGAVLSAPWADASLGDNRITTGARSSFNDSAAAILGLVTQVNSRYNYTPNADGSVNAQAPGSAVLRKFRGEEAEMYISDTWKATRNLTITAGLRYMYWPAIYEENGVQTSTNIPLSQWFDTRVANAGNGLAGGTGLPPISYQLANKGGRPLYDNLKNWSPRLAAAYSPDGKSGLGKLLFGGPGKSVIRAGFGIYYDVLGSGLVREFDASALGLSTSINNASGRETIASAARFTGIRDIPQSLVSAPPPARFPVEQPNNFAITNSLDDRIAAPYTMRYNLSFAREFSGGWNVNVGYVASQGKRTINSEDLATPLNIRDPQSGTDYFTAATALTDQARRNVPVGQVQRIPYWENMFPGLAGGGLTATQVAYRNYADFFPDSTGALENLDRFGDPSASRLGRFAYYNQQFSYLRALRSVGFSTYNSMQVSVQKRFSKGDQLGFNWTWAHSIDTGSTSEDNATAGRGISINPYNRYQMRGSSDFDQRHSFNANYVYGIPVGKGQKYFSQMTGITNTIFGGWQLAGIWRQTSGLPVSVGHNRTWPTNYNIAGWATQIDNFADGTNKNAPAPPGGRSGPNIFVDPAAALRAFDFTSPGQIGSRNTVRGDGLFNMDMNLSKSFQIREGHALQLRWEVFNVTNSVRFDPLNITLSLASPAAFGRYAGTLGGPRVMQFGLRYDF